MADVEDEAEFGSHFLDSMLEVEMTEDDNELDMSKTCDPLETLPPVPTFDLQSETFSYKDVYKNSIPQPVLPSPAAPKVPLAINPNSVLIYSGKVPTQKPAPYRAPVQVIPPKPNAKNSVKSPVVNNARSDDTTKGKFMQEVFRPEFVQNVFVEADTHSDIALVSEEEMMYYKTCFKDVSKVQNCRVHCTICDKHIGCAVTVERKINVHNMLKVLTCKPCHEFYGDGNFPCDKGDNCEIYCRWCGQGGALVCCSFCPRVFCKKCVRRNYGSSFLKSIEKASDWACFCCAQKPLWPHRAICRALIEYLAQKKTDPKTSLKDTTSCCKAAGLVRKKLRATLDKNKLNSTTTTTPPSHPKTPNLKNKALSPLKPSKGHFLFSTTLKPKALDLPKTSSSPSNRPSKPASLPSIFSPRSILTGNTIIRGITTNNAPKFVSTLPSSQLIQTPVIHGETLITPPPRLLLHPKPQPTPISTTATTATTPTPTFTSPSSGNSCVRVSLVHQAPNVDLKKIPAVKIPHEVQGLVLRLIFPDNKMQYVRLTSDGSGCKAGKEFPMPQFPETGACFVEENLVEAFKVCKTMYEKLLRIREKMNSRTKLTEESVLDSSVRKLHLAYEKTMELFKELDRTLSENHAEWKKGGGTVDVIDISDDEAVAGKKAKGERPDRYSTLREKCRTLNDDSDIEILADLTVNGKTAPSGNFKEKYRSRRCTDQAKAHPAVNAATKKRKKGRPRKHNKRLKVSKMHNGKTEEAAAEERVASGSATDEEPEVETTKSANEAPGDAGEGGKEKEDAEGPDSGQQPT